MPEPNATPAPLTMTPEKEQEYRAICSSGGTEVDPVFAELDATRAKLAEAEAIVVQSHCDLTTLNRSLTAAESRVAALTEALTNARTHVYCGCSRPRVRHDHDCPRGKVEAALSPSQDAKEARDA